MDVGRSLLPILVGCTMLGMGGFTIVLPSLPSIMEHYGVATSKVMLVQAVYLLGMGLAQLFLGALSDRLGRRLVVLYGTALFTAGSLICSVSPNIWILVAGRLLQAVGAAAGLSMARAILRDVYGLRDAARKLAYVTTAMVVAPILAPIAGGALDVRYGWQASFYAATILGLVLLAAVARKLPETLTRHRDGFGHTGFLASFSTVVRNRYFLGNALQSALGTTSFQIFLAAVPFVLMQSMGVAPDVLGYWLILPAISYMAGNLVCGAAASIVSRSFLIHAAILLQVASVLAMALIAAAGALTPLSLMLTAMIFNMSNGLLLPNTITGATGAVPGHYGMGAGLTGCLQMVLSAACAAAIGNTAIATAGPMIGGMMAVVACSAVVLLVLKPTVPPAPPPPVRH